MYAFVKLYSRRAASRARGRISGRRLLAGQFLKVSFELVKTLKRPWNNDYNKNTVSVWNLYLSTGAILLVDTLY